MISFFTNASSITLGSITLASSCTSGLFNYLGKKLILASQESEKFSSLKKIAGIGLLILGVGAGVVTAAIAGVSAGISLSTVNPIFGIVGGALVGAVSLAFTIHQLVKTILEIRKNGSKEEIFPQPEPTINFQTQSTKSKMPASEYEKTDLIAKVAEFVAYAAPAKKEQKDGVSC